MSYSNATKVCLSVPQIGAKTVEGMKTKKVSWDERVRDGVVVGIGWGVSGGERRDAKTCFSARRAVYVHYFKDIRQGALQSDSVRGVTTAPADPAMQGPADPGDPYRHDTKYKKNL